MLTLAVAQTIATATLAEARAKGMKPLCVVVLDQRGALKAALTEDGTSLKRYEVARGKADGALAFNLGSRTLAKMAVERPHFFTGATHAVGGGLVPVPGGVLIRDATGMVIGTVGVSGDSSDNDEAAAVAGIRAAGLTADGG